MNPHNRVSELLAAMTIAEKVAQTRSIRVADDQDLSDEALQTLIGDGIGAIQMPFTNLDALERVHKLNRIQRFLRDRTKSGVPALIQDESLHGHLAVGATSYPVPIAMACSWDVDLVNRVYTSIRREMRSRGAHTTHGPVLDLGRDPRWGRIEETWGENSFLVSEMACAIVTGLQGDPDGGQLRHDGVVAACKHFVGYSQSVGGRNFAPSNIPLREFVEQYLRPFKRAVVDAGALGIMPSHCDVDGVPCHGSRRLLTEILRDDWGFRGIVVSDYHDASRLHLLHRVAVDMPSAARMALRAGLDMDLPTGECYALLDELAGRDAQVSADLDRAVLRILDVKERIGLFQRCETPATGLKVIRTADHIRLALEAAHKSIVLLRNRRSILPLDRSSAMRVGVIGPNAHPLYTGAYSSKKNNGVSVLTGLRHRAEGTTMEIKYSAGCRITRGEDSGTTELEERIAVPELADRAANAELIAAAEAMAAGMDLNILCIGGNDLTSREAVYFGGNRGDRDDITPAGDQLELFRRIKDTGKPIIVLVLAGKPLAIPEILDEADAVLYCWYLGEETGTAVADVLFGAVNPSGKTAVTFARSVGQLPVHSELGRTAWFKEYLFTVSGPLVPFGYGLSYTRFEYSAIEFDAENWTVSARVANVGPRAGDEIVQLYVTDEFASIVRPEKELKGFKRIGLESGSSTRVAFAIDRSLLEFVNQDLEPVYEPGEYRLTIGSNSVEGLSIRVNLT